MRQRRGVAAEHAIDLRAFELRTFQRAAGGFGHEVERAAAFMLAECGAACATQEGLRGLR